MARIPSPPVNNTGAPTGPGALDGAGNTSIDALRQYVIFELVNVLHTTPTVPQGRPVFPYLAMHMNPEQMQVSYQKLITRQITRGGFVEQHWGEELDSLSCSGSTGAFVTIGAGLSALNRKASIGYRKYLELQALYRNGGMVYDQRGNIVFEGGVHMHFDSNIYQGYFENFTANENAEKPWVFTLDFTFKVKKSVFAVGR